MTLTKEQLLKINGGKNEKEVDYYLDALNEILPKYEINTPLRIAHFLAQVLHESAYLKFNVENLNYSAEGLLTTFKKYFDNRELAEKYARKPERIANRVYANRMGNGNEASGDGWKYRGRGLIQLTGRSNYTACGNYIGVDIANIPDLILESPMISVKAACWFWTVLNKLNPLADKDDVVGITKKVNGGLNGIDDRKNILTRAKGVLK
jgi:putative chitinase